MFITKEYDRVIIVSDDRTNNETDNLIMQLIDLTRGKKCAVISMLDSHGGNEALSFCKQTQTTFIGL